jgi:hypothetical protein
LKISTDNDQQISSQNATPARVIEPVAQEIIIKEKMTMVLPRGKAGYPQDICKTEVGGSERGECL